MSVKVKRIEGHVLIINEKKSKRGQKYYQVYIESQNNEIVYGSFFEDRKNIKVSILFIQIYDISFIIII